MEDFDAYYKSVYSEELELLIITPDKVHVFVYYQAYRIKKKRLKKRVVLGKNLIEMTTIDSWTTIEKEVLWMFSVCK